MALYSRQIKKRSAFSVIQKNGNLMNIMNKRNKRGLFSKEICAIVSILLCIFPQTVYADSSWVWLTDMRPIYILPVAAVLTIAIETVVIWGICKPGSIWKVMWVALIANACSFLLPYVVLYCESKAEIYSFSEMLDLGPNWIVGWLFLALTILFEMPIAYVLLKNQVESVKKLLITIVGVNVITTAMVAVIERMVTNGYWGA